MKTINQKLSLGTSKGLYFFSPDEILRLEASSNYTFIHFTNNTKLLSSKVLKEFEQMLEPFGFVRTHRTHLVNRKHILCVTSDGNIIMKDASIAEISRRMKSGVMRALRNAA
ncbi:MAG: LytTR family transcriptional regulator [Bacteroidetes bacterium]|nr:MAG: LytTR family transcriptional regulator [Bacteroidota bacterium]